MAFGNGQQQSSLVFHVGGAGVLQEALVQGEAGGGDMAAQPRVGEQGQDATGAVAPWDARCAHLCPAGAVRPWSICVVGNLVCG